MALTISTSDWTGANVRKTLSFNAALVSKLRIYTTKVTFGGSDNYVTGGVSADLKQAGVSTLVAVIPTYDDSLRIVQYDKTNEKIQLYDVGNPLTGGETQALTEVVNTSSACASKVFEFLVIGY